MSNPQVEFLASKGLKVPLTNDLIAFFSKMPNISYTSHEIDALIVSASYNSLKRLLLSYSNSGFAEPSSHIGSLCSDLAKRGILKNSKKYCPYLHKKKDAFSK